MMSKKLFVKFLATVLVVITAFNTIAFSQNVSNPTQAKKPFSERLFFGGSLGFSFGSYSTMVEVSPVVGYAVTDDFMAGIGLTYMHYNYNNYYRNLSDGSLTDLKMNIYGSSLWARYFLTRTQIPVIENLFAHVEYEPLFVNHSFKYDPSGNFSDPYGNRYANENDQITLQGIFLGGGIRQPIGGRSFMYLEVLWNINEELYSPYSNPRIRIGIAAGF